MSAKSAPSHFVFNRSQKCRIDTDECFVLCTHFKPLRLRYNSFVCFHLFAFMNSTKIFHTPFNYRNPQPDGFESWKPLVRSGVKTPAFSCLCMKLVKGVLACLVERTVTWSECDIENAQACGCSLRSVRLALYGLNSISQTELLSRLSFLTVNLTVKQGKHLLLVVVPLNVLFWI